MPLTNRELLARMIRCEAEAEGQNGMRAVASVIMNRVRVPYGEYQRVGQGNIRNILLQPGQFTCAATTINGTPNIQNIYNIPPEDVHYEIADWALGGGRFFGVSNSLWYYNPEAQCINYFPLTQTGSYFTTVNQHCFYIPTPKYKTT
jgi:N-acetylmuramoyl-L-alanine amidase